MWNNVPLNGWPQLRGMENLSEALTVLDDVTALKLAVGNEDNGLIKDVDDLQTTVGDNTAGLVKDVDDLQTTVGDATAGLVKDVDDLQTTVGDATAGLVKDVDDLQTTVGDNTAGLVKGVSDLNTMLTPTAYTRDGLTPSKCTINAGSGFARVGNLIFVNLRITATATDDASIIGFPVYTNTTNSVNIVGGSGISINDHLPVTFFIGHNGQLVIYGVTNEASYALQFAYVADAVTPSTRDGDTEEVAEPETKTTKRSTKKTNGGE